MHEFLLELIPNIMSKPEIFWKSILETLSMMGITALISFVLGGALGIILTVTKRGGILEQTSTYQILSAIVNFFRSIPFVILIVGLLPVTRAIVGTSIGVKGAIVPLVFGTVPFFARQIETALAEVNPGLIEAAQAMGTSPMGIIFRIYLKESVAPIARGTTITAISLLGLTAMAGAVGAGGLGDFAIRFGHQRNQVDVTYVSVLVLVLMVGIIQGVGSLIVKKTKH